MNERERIQRFVQLIGAEPADANCQRCLHDLHDYVSAQLADAPYVDRHPETVAHLDQCVACAEAYARLYEALRAEQMGTLPHPEQVPSPDLSFLEPSQGETLTEQLRRRLSATADHISFQLSEAMLPLLRPPAVALRAAADEERYAERLLDLSPDNLPGVHEFPLALSAYRDIEQPDRCLVEVTVAPPGRSWPDLAGVRVTLSTLQPPRSGRTDAWGVVVFEDVPIAALADLGVDVEL